MKTFFAYLKSLWLRFRRRHEIKAVHVASRSDVPDKLGNALYIVGDPAKWAVLKCPCGCGDTIDVNLMMSRKPVWRLTFTDGKPSFHPSLWVPKAKCGAHFWIKSGKIIWV